MLDLFICNKKDYKKIRTQADYEKMRLKFFNEGINSLKELKISQKENLFLNNFSKYNTQLSQVSIKQSILTSDLRLYWNIWLYVS